jgi:predicted Zn finger-like uncharacterized protein
LFTQCSNCHTVFRLSAETLRAAGGQVRCGRCGEIFNALARLAEEPGAFPRRESPLEMEMRADEILRSVTPPSERAEEPVDDIDEDSAGPELARLEIIDERPSPPAQKNPPAAPAAESAAAASVAKPPAAARPADPAAAPPAKSAAEAGTAIEPSPPENEAPGEEPSFEFTLPPGELDRVFVEVAPRSRSPISAAALALSEAAVENLAGVASEARSRRAAGFEVSEEVRHEMLAGIADEPFEDLVAPAPRPRSRFLWLGAAIVLALLLIGQMIHENRAWLAVHAPWRGPLRGLYAALGVAVQVPANLSAYQLRQWGVTGDPAAAGTLRVRASILNTAAQLQPYPLLRVTLANRFGARVGMRDFEPAEYLGKPIVRMLAPGERADATLDIVDPGKDAEGFEIDVCLRGADQKISCAGDATQQVKSIS